MTTSSHVEQPARKVQAPGIHAQQSHRTPTDDRATPSAASTPRATDEPRKRTGRYIPALDGIRALAVVAVVLYHLRLPWMQGGLLGVTMFFAISGHIITKLLINEFDQAGTIDLKGFWIRRGRRLLPAVLGLVILIIPLCAIFNRVMLTKMRPDILPSLLFFNNWWQILQNVSYFDALGDPSPLTHFWSLAIEAQFYLVWPVLLFGLLGSRAKRSTIRRGALVAAGVSALAMALLYDPSVDPSRVYYGTDTRVFSLLLGAWLAFIPEKSMAPRQILRFTGLYGVMAKALPPSRSENADGAPSDGGNAVSSVDLIGAVGLLGLVALFFWSNGYSAFQYRGGMLLCSLLTLALIAACVQEQGLLARLFSAKPLVWLGKRSYSIYLWHFPLLSLMNPVSNINATPWWQILLQLAIVLAVAEASYRFIETPFRHGLVGKLVAHLREGDKPLDIARRHAIPVIAGALAAFAAIVCLIIVPDTSALSPEGAALLNGSEASQQGPSTAGDPADDGKDAAGFSKDAYDILMIGDSVSVRTVPDFEETFAHGHIDAKKNRQFTAGIELLDGYLANNVVGRIVVIALGTNGLVTDEQIDTMMQRIGPDRVAVFITTRSPQPWVGPTNEAICRAADRYDNVSVIDWFALSEGRNELFDGDGTHLSSEGAAQYVSLIYDAVRMHLPVHPDDHVETKVEDATKRIADSLCATAANCLTPSGALETQDQ